MRSREEQLEQLETELLNLRNDHQKDHNLESAAVLAALLRELEDLMKGRWLY